MSGTTYPTAPGLLPPTVLALLEQAGGEGGEVDLSGLVTTTQLNTALAALPASGAMTTQHALNANKTMTNSDWNCFLNFTAINNVTLSVVPPTTSGKWILVGNMATGNVTVSFNLGTSVVYGKGIDGVVQYGTLDNVVLPIGRMMLVFCVSVGQPNYYWILVY